MARLGRFAAMLALGLSGLMAAGAVSHGQGTGSAWHESSYNRVRLVSGGDLGDARLAGIHIRLDPGWKTYWRMPGDAGVPPLADWSASVNAAQVEMLWPAPTRHVDPWATTVGYVGEVVFPVVVTPADPALPVSLRLTLTYAVCSDICIPVEAGLAVDLAPGEPGPDRALIDSYRDTVPRAGTLADAGIAAVTVEGEGEATRLVVDIAPSAPGVEPDIFVEGPAAFYFGTPETTPAAAGRLRLAIPVDGVKADRPLAGTSLKLTVFNGERRVEHELSVN
jgi:DsbC/DsbD-like thiol-disulfide interchange protein